MPTGPGSARLIGLVGAECTGKTTLARFLATEPGTVVVGEVLRTFVEHHGRPPRSDEQRMIMARQQQSIDDARCRAQLVVADPHPAMTAIYSQVYFADPGLDDEALALLRSCDVIVWCQPDFPWVPDPGQRDGEQWRTAAQLRIGPLLEQADVAFVIAEGPLASRVARVRAALASLGSTA